MAEISIAVTGDKGTLANLVELQRQVPFALRKTVARVAVDVQTFLIGRHIPRQIQTRGTWLRKGTKYGVNVNFPRGLGSGGVVQAGVTSAARWLDFQEFGGQKTPSNKKIIIPVVGGARPSFDKPFDRKLKPTQKNTQAAPKGGRKRGKKRSGTMFWNAAGTAVYQRRPTGLKLLWTATDKSVSVRPRLSFGTAGAKHGNGIISLIAAQEIAAALVTSKRVKFTV